MVGVYRKNVEAAAFDLFPKTGGEWTGIVKPVQPNFRRNLHRANRTDVYVIVDIPDGVERPWRKFAGTKSDPYERVGIEQ